MKRALWATTFLVTIVATPVQADPFTAAIAATASSVFGAAATGTAFTFFGFTGASAILASFATRAALGYALDALTPKPGKKTTIGRGYKVPTYQSDAPHAVVYGKTKVGGVVFYQTTTGTNNRYLHQCIAFAGHEIDSFDAFYINEDKVTIDGTGNVTVPSKYNGFVRINTHTGTTTQAADSDLVAEVTEWTTAHQAKGIAYAYVRYDFSTTVFPNGVPALTAVIKGRKVYDPRDATTAWSANPALCLYDYMTASFGVGETSGGMDATIFSTAASVCDETVSGANRYTCNGAFTLEEKPEDVVRAILSSMGGMIWFSQGLWKSRAAAYVAPSLTFDEDDARGALKVATKQPRRDNFNQVRGTYNGEETLWQDTDYTAVTNATYVTEDGGDTIEVDLPLPFTSTSAMANRIATIALNRNRKQITVTGAFGLRAMDVQVGDTVMLTNSRLGYSSKIFEVTDWRLGLVQDMDIQSNMVLREIDTSVFA